MAEKTGDFRIDLRNKAIEMAQETPAAPVETPVETPEAVASTPDVTPETPISEPVTESTSVPEAAPAEVVAATESTSSAQPTPASDVPSTSARDTLSKRGLNFPDEKTAAEYLRVESELAARVRAEKEAKRAQPTTEPQPVATPVVPEPTPTPAPVAAAPVAPASTTPEPPEAGTVALPPVVEQEIARLVAEDSTCRAIADEYHALEAELPTIAKFDSKGYPVAGKAFELNREIAELERVLAGPSEALKKHGFEVPSLDAIQQAEIKSRILELKIERRDLFDTYQAKAGRFETLRTAFHDRANSFRTHFESQALTAKAEADRYADIDARAASFEKRWLAEEAAVIQANKVPTELTEDIKDALKTAARAHLAIHGAITEDELPQLMRDAAAKELQRSDRYHRAKSAEYAKAKLADVATATPAPPPNAAVASPAPIDNPDWKQRLKAKRQALLSS